MKLSSFFQGVALTFLLSACASVMDNSNQNLLIQTPGVTGARCVVKTEDFRAIAHPPAPIFIRRMAAPLTINCQAPGNREKTIVVRSSLNKTAMANVANAGVGATYDHFSGALYTYPSPVVVDFTHVRAAAQDLPAYHAADTVSPFDQVNEDMQDRPAQTPAEQGLKTSIPKKKSNLISKEAPKQEPYKTDIERPY